MRLIEHDYVIEALATDWADCSFCVRILPRTRRRGDHFGDAHTRHSPAEALAVDAVPIAMQPSGSGVVRECVDDLLGGPLGSWMLCDVEMHDAARNMRQHDH